MTKPHPNCKDSITTLGPGRRHVVIGRSSPGWVSIYVCHNSGEGKAVSLPEELLAEWIAKKGSAESKFSISNTMTLGELRGERKP